MKMAPTYFLTRHLTKHGKNASFKKGEDGKRKEKIEFKLEGLAEERV